MSKPALIYARFSTLEQGKGFSLERQVEAGKSYIAQQGWSLTGVITDEGRSAFHGANRIAGSSLHEFEANSLKGLNKGVVLCVENIDRLSREGAKEALQLVWKLNEQGVDVATWHDGKIYRAEAKSELIDLFTIIISGGRAHDESVAKSKRTKGSWVKRRSKIAAGDKSAMVGQPPAWIEVRDGAYAVIERRKEVLNEIFDRHIEGWGAQRIVKLLNGRNEEPWTTHNRPVPGQGWYTSYIHRLIQSRSVLGEYSTGDGTLVNATYFPQAVSHAKFAKAQSAKEDRQRKGGWSRHQMKNLLSGITTCGECGSPMAYEDKGSGFTRKHKLKSGEVKLYSYDGAKQLICDSYRRGRGCTNKTKWPYGVVEDRVLTRVLALEPTEFSDPQTLLLEEELARLAAALEALRVQETNVVEALASGAPKALVAKLSSLEAEIAEVGAAIKSTDDKLQSALAQAPVSDDVEAIRLLRADLESKDDDIRLYARRTTNKTLRRVVETLTMNECGGVTLLTGLTVDAWDRNGQWLGGQAV